MKTLILDAYTMNPGDLSWEAWKALGSFVKYDRTPKELVVQRAADAEIVLVNKVRMTAEVIAQLPKLRYIGVLATGYDVVDVQAARQAGVTVTNVPAYSTDSVAQLVFAFILEHYQKVALYSQEVHKGAWQASPDFTFSIARGHIALVCGISEDGTMARVVDSAPSATYERIVDASLYYQMRSGAFRAALTLDDLPGARWYFETDEYGGLEYYLTMDYVAKRGVRLIQPISE